MNVEGTVRGGILLMISALSLLAFAVAAQEMTERHIPVGAYPALAGEGTLRGTIAAVDEASAELTLESNGSERRFRVTERTKIWIDRSAVGQTTLDGSLGDLEAGLQAEVKSLSKESPQVAYWVKVRQAGR